MLDPGWTPENNGNTLPSRMLFAEYGFRLYYDYSENHEDRKEHHGVYFSPMGSLSIFGAEFTYTVWKSFRFGFYFYFPVHFPAAYYF